MEILGVVSKNFPGVTSVFEYGKSLGLWDYVFSENTVCPISANLIIFGGLAANYEMIMKGSAGKKVLLWTSSAGQTAFREIPILQKVFSFLNSGLIDELWVGSESFYDALKSDDRVKFFPYPFNSEFVNVVKGDCVDEDSRRFNVSLFSPIDIARKNLFVQYHGFLMAQKEESKLILHNNVVSDQPGLFINTYGWLEKNDLFNVLKNSRINLSVFPFESFGYSVAEAIVCDCIPIMSQAIKDNFKFDFDIPLVKNVDSPSEIKDKILEVAGLSNREAKKLSLRLNNHLVMFSKKNLQKLRFLLKS